MKPIWDERRWKKEEGRRKKEEGRRKKEEGRGEKGEREICVCTCIWEKGKGREVRARWLRV